MKQTKIILTDIESSINPSSDELANVVISRLGLIPRKKGATKDMPKVLVEMYERSKYASKEKNPQLGVMTVEDMGSCAGITRQTMYDYLKRWLDLQLIKKISFMKDGVLVVGYVLNGNTLENAFQKTKSAIMGNLDVTERYIKELQKELKNEKLRKMSKKEEEEEDEASDEQ